MQPMHLGRWHLVLNGEIYNYRELRAELATLGHAFLTEGDGEVPTPRVAEWEEGALGRLDGMFAFAIWDDGSAGSSRVRPIHSARSRSTGRRIEHGSSSPRISVRCLKLDPASVPRGSSHSVQYLGRGVMPPIDQSFFAGVNRLPAAHLLRLRDDRVRVEAYWRPHLVEVPSRYEEAAERLRELLLESIGRRLRADVPVGTSLSGGVDSSAVVALSASLAGDHRHHAFTARFPGFSRDEWRYAHDVATAAEVVEHHAVEPTAAGLLDDLDAVVSAQEEPFGSSSIYAQWCLMRAARSSGVTVLLDGQGADEIFGGYPRFERVGTALDGTVRDAAGAGFPGATAPMWSRHLARSACLAGSRGAIAAHRSRRTPHVRSPMKRHGRRRRRGRMQAA